MFSETLADDFEEINSFSFSGDTILAASLALKGYSLLIRKNLSIFKDLRSITVTSGLLHKSGQYIYRIELYLKKSGQKFVAVCYFNPSSGSSIGNPVKVEISEVDPRTSFYKKRHTFAVVKKDGKYIVAPKPVFKKVTN